jgi:hypothetical protein
MGLHFAQFLLKIDLFAPLVPKLQLGNPFGNLLLPVKSEKT